MHLMSEAHCMCSLQKVQYIYTLHIHAGLPHILRSSIYSSTRGTLNDVYDMGTCVVIQKNCKSLQSAVTLCNKLLI